MKPLVMLALACAVALACGPTQRPDGGKGLLSVGSTVPALSAVDHNQHPVSLRDSKAPILLYFYPKDGTPGCTKEACALRDAWDQYRSAGIVVVGVSSDSSESHRKFAKEHELPFSLVSDPDHAWCAAFGVPSPAGFDKRISFLIGKDSKIYKVYPDVDPGVHADQVLKDVRALGWVSAP